MNEAAIRQRLAELNHILQGVPLATQAKTASGEGVYASHSPVAKGGIEEALDQVRLQVKYIVFDLEATRRENRYLRQMLESRPPTDLGEDEPK